MEEVDPNKLEAIDPIGEGSIRKTKKVKKPTVKLPPPPEVIKLDGEKVWIDVPTMQDQFKKPGMWKLEKYQAIIFDLSKELEAYNKFLQDISSPLTNRFMLSSDKQYDSNTGSWKILITYQIVKFLKVIKNGKSNEQQFN